MCKGNAFMLMTKKCFYYADYIRSEYGAPSVRIALSYGYPLAIYRLSYGVYCCPAAADKCLFRCFFRRFSDVFQVSALFFISKRTSCNGWT